MTLLICVCTLLQSMAATTHATRRVRRVCFYSNAHLEGSVRQGSMTVPHVVRVSTVPLHSVTQAQAEDQQRHVTRQDKQRKHIL